MYKQGDIVVVKFPFTDGSEFKKRPALIISNASVNKTQDYLIVQITSKATNDTLSIAINDTDCINPLPLRSYICSHKIVTVHQSHILSKITAAKPVFITRVADKIYGLIKKYTRGE